MSLMFILSPAKRMAEDGGEPLPTAEPALLERTRHLAEVMRRMAPAELQALWRCSDAIARDMCPRHARMDLDGLLARGSSAAASYRGIAYQHLAAQVMDAGQLAYLQRHLRILSAFFGVLRPLDAVVPYRLEMAQRLAVPACPRLGLPAAKDLYAWWGDTLAGCLRQEGCDALVNVASAEYARAVVPHMGKVPVVTCQFGQLRPADGAFVQRATEAKAARGDFVRWCAERGVTAVAELAEYRGRGYVLDEARSTADTLAFVRR